MKRRIDETRMNQSKERTMEQVMNTITKQPRFSFRIPRIRVFVASLSVLVIALVVMLNTPNPINPDPETGVVINAYESEKIAEISYLTTSLIGSSIQVNDPYLMQLGYSFVSEDTTSFEENDDQINLYFDILKVFLEDDMMDNEITVTVDEENPNIQTIVFSIEGITYTLVVEFDKENFTGTLSFNGTEYQVEGLYEETDQELKFNLKAINGDDFVQIEFKTENKEVETEAKYEIRQRYQGVESEKDVKISNEQNESKVVINEDNNEYELKKELEDGEVKYKLQYRINEVVGSAVITETVDNEGNPQYNYSINENGVSKVIEKGKPEQSNNSSNGNPNEDNNGNGNGNNDDTGRPDNPGNPNTSTISDL